MEVLAIELNEKLSSAKLELLLERMAAMWELQVLQSVALLAESSVLELETHLDRLKMTA